MKRKDYKTSLCQAFMTLAFMGAMSACVEEDIYSDNFKKASADGLSVMTSVSESTVVTRATTESDETLNEKHLQTLDVFVEPVADPGKFMKQYHLVATDTKPIQEQVNNLLADNWRAEGLEMGKYYNIYVATNNTQTSSTKDLSTFDVEALKGLVASEVIDGIAVVDETTNNISWPWTDQFANTPSGFIYKQYVSEDDAASVTVNGSLYGYTTEKEFMMDGILENWTPDANTRDQVFGTETKPVILNRAAAKIVLNLHFDEEFLHSLTHNKKVTTEGGTETVTWEAKPAAEQVTITGAPAWRFYNFAFGAPVFAPETQGAGVEVHNSATLLRHPYNFVIDSNLNDNEMPVAAQIITYTYPNMWAQADYATDAPSLVISVPFTEGTGSSAVTNYHYYRIPLVKSTVTAIERNHIYVVNATIATRGSELHEDVDEIENVYYEVLPWNDESNSSTIHSEVESVQHYYFKVNPKVYTLRGDGDQSVILTYLKAAGTKVNWKLFTYDASGNQTGVVAKDEEGAIRAWFYNANDVFTTTYNDNEQGVNWSNTGPTPMGVDIVQSTEGTSGTSGTVTVTSHALNNRAIKYIRLRVYLDEAATFQNGKETMYEDIIIRHFPTDNIQNIVGSWSSYHNEGSGTQQVTLTTTSLVEAEAWKTQYGVNYTTQDVNVTDYISYDEYTAHAGESGYTMTGPTASSYNAFHTAIQTYANRQAANSQENAIADAGEGHIYYWGTNAQQVYQETTYEPNTVAYYYDFDYYTSRQQGRWTYYTYYKYSNYYTATYTHAHTQTQYSMTVEMVSTGNWVDWDRDNGKTYNQANVKYTRSTIFTARVYNESDGRIYAQEPVRSGTTNANYQYTYRMATSQAANGYYWYRESDGYGTGNANMTNLTNNHMYVIQISSTSEGYIMGRPILGNPNANLSQDDVVSPAFMIASQLGATSTTSDNQVAATHCSRYMEVAADGTRYTGWRLPTPDEIGVITRYQQGSINGVTITNTAYQAMTPVLTGRYYWSLTGNSVETSDQYSGGTYLRCVRDLSAAEVDAINGFDKIIEKYQGSGN